MNIQLPSILDYSEIPTAVPYPIQILRQKPWWEFVRHNGYQKLAKRLMLKVYSDMDSAEELWNEFSPNTSFFDLWEVRKSFYESFDLEPYFLSLYEETGAQKQTLGVLPLWLDNDSFKNKYTWGGGYWPEDNTFFVKDIDIVPLLLMAAPKPLYLSCIKPQNEYSFLHVFPGYQPEDHKKYYLNIKTIKSVEDYLHRLKKKKRHNIKRDQRRILSLNPRVHVNNFAHIEDLFRLNIDRFRGMKLELNDPDMASVFEDGRHQELFRKFIRNEGRYKVRVIATEIGGSIEAVEIAFIVNNVYYSVSSGANIARYSGLGVFSNLLVIDDAIKNNCDTIDFFEGDYNWKNSWDLDCYYQYKFVK